ncbi:MAG: dTDP-glucose 4,6-dehydratase, partial [Rickettsiales bacterium]|nr:dTDP-glucose 4,6-dehydratase [Rickettsiales bacterium]
AASTLPWAVQAKDKPSKEAKETVEALRFTEVERLLDKQLHVAPGYDAKVLIRWGDPLRPTGPTFDPKNQSEQKQERQFGYNNDFTAFFPLPAGSRNSAHGLLGVNHEYTIPPLMFSGLEMDYLDSVSEEQMRVEQAAHGVSIIEVKRDSEQGWHPVDGTYARRVTATTPILLSGPVAGHERVKTQLDPSGKRVFGTFANCAGGITPWGTYLTCEENIDKYFAQTGEIDPRERDNHKRMGIKPGGQWYSWYKFDRRFNASREPNEPNRFGWIVEIDPYNPQLPPVKRTALGRCKHECATTTLDHNNHVVVYSGDDEYFQYLYRFVSAKPYDPEAPSSHLRLLDEGTLSVAQFDDEGNVRWLPLVHGTGKLTSEHGFDSQADVLIEARRASELIGATPMDRPEDIAVYEKTGEVFVALTKNGKRTDSSAANPRTENHHGHIVRLTPPKHVNGGIKHSADTFKWDIFLLAGDPDAQAHGAKYGGEVSDAGWLSCPDNLAMDPHGRLWITTDGQEDANGAAEGLYATQTHGDAQGVTKCFLRGPLGCEVTGPNFTPDGQTLFLSIQHPGEGSTFDAPATRWPDFDESLPPRPAVLAITKKDDGSFGA